MSAVNQFVKKFDRTPHKVSGDVAEYRGIQELDKIIDRAKKILEGMGVIYSMKKEPILKGFVLTIPDQEVGD